MNDHVATITFNRPQALNALDRPARQQLRDALRKVEDPAIRAVILTGSGRAFSVGQDLAELTNEYERSGPQLGRLIQDEWGPIVAALRHLPKPVIAAVNGAAAGGGLSLALAADIRLAEPRTAFIAAFVNVALAPDSGASHMLVRMVGVSKAMELMLSGAPLTAPPARDWGLVARIADDAEAMRQEAQMMALRFAEGPPLAYAAIKQILYSAQDQAFEPMVDLEARLQDRLGRSDDHREAINAFLAKRAPQFSGR